MRHVLSIIYNTLHAINTCTSCPVHYFTEKLEEMAEMLTGLLSGNEKETDSARLCLEKQKHSQA